MKRHRESFGVIVWSTEVRNVTDVSVFFWFVFVIDLYCDSVRMSAFVSTGVCSMVRFGRAGCVRCGFGADFGRDGGM